MSDDYLDTTAPTHETLALLGSINYAWAQLDLVSSAAFASLLKLDPAELGITIGRIETQAKINKMHSISRHRRNKHLSDFLAKKKIELARLRPMRNAVTHGAYMGKSSLGGELCFRLPAEFIIDEGDDTAHEMVTITISELQQHTVDITKIAVALIEEFNILEMRKLFDLPVRVRRRGNV